MLTDKIIEEAGNRFKGLYERSAFIEGAVFVREFFEKELKNLRKAKRERNKLKLEKSWIEDPECMGR